MGKKAKIAILLLTLGLAVFIYFAYQYFNFIKEFATTDAMFVKSNKITNISFKRVGGKLIKLYFKEGDNVEKGDLMAEIDSTDYKVKLEAITKKIESLKKKKEQLDIQIDRVSKELVIKKQNAQKNVEYIEKEIKSIKYNIEEMETNIEQMTRDYNRYKTLYEQKAVSKRSYEDIETKLKSLKQKKKSLESKLEGLIKQKDMAYNNIRIIEEKFKQIKELEKTKESLIKQIDAAKQEQKDTKNLISYCKLYAPFDGVVGKKYVEVGTVVNSGYPIYSIVDTKDLYVEVLLEETKMNGVKKGAPATFRVDAYPNIEFKGIVESIYPASAATYALVPRDISAGEFTKVAQRIPIKIKITEGNISLLKVGMGGEVRIKRVN
ncbi:HlyD family secretion protein [Deferribacter abyssi]|uniref:HlyD family secretion protein n=1 Tax=Deferribacter abyssi TaxID=213806 RepID=UPI003C293910